MPIGNGDGATARPSFFGLSGFPARGLDNLERGRLEHTQRLEEILLPPREPICKRQPPGAPVRAFDDDISDTQLAIVLVAETRRWDSLPDPHRAGGVDDRLGIHQPQIDRLRRRAKIL